MYLRTTTTTVRNHILTYCLIVVNKNLFKGVKKMKIANNDIKLQAKISGVRLWQVAQRLGITDSTFSRKLRNELSEKEKERIFNIIEELRS